MPVDIEITLAVGSDNEWCARLMVASEPWITLGRDLDSARATMSRPGTELFLAHEGAERVGFLLLAPYGLAGAPYIACIAIAENARDRGIGSEMLKWAERHYADRHNLFLLVSSFNTGAQQLYLRHGYEKVGEIPDYVVKGHSELIFRKRLA